MAERHLRDTGGDPATIEKLRRRRVTFDDIATHLSITRAQVITIYAEAITEAARLDTPVHLAEELAIADDAIRDLLTIARTHQPSARTSVEAWNAIRGWSEHKSRLLGLLNPKQQPEEPRSGLAKLRAAK